MTRREDDALLDTVNEWLETSEQERSVLDDVQALLAFALLCVALFVALHVGVV